MTLQKEHFKRHEVARILNETRKTKRYFIALERIDYVK